VLVLLIGRIMKILSNLLFIVQSGRRKYREDLNSKSMFEIFEIWRFLVHKLCRQSVEIIHFWVPTHSFFSFLPIVNVLNMRLFLNGNLRRPTTWSEQVQKRTLASAIENFTFGGVIFLFWRALCSRFDFPLFPIWVKRPPSDKKCNETYRPRSSVPCCHHSQQP
jgi:hypothetical protein